MDKKTSLRIPATPLVVHDPTFSVWSMADRLTDDWTKHWTGTQRKMVGLCRVDGKTRRFAGSRALKAEPMEQVSCKVLPTRTVYVFRDGKVELTLTFLTPVLPGDLDLVGRPLTYVLFDVRSVDGKRHAVSLYFDVGAEWATNEPRGEDVSWGRYNLEGMDLLRTGTVSQPVLQKRGDNLRADWGCMALAVPFQDGASTAAALGDEARRAFRDKGTFPAFDDMRMPRDVGTGSPVLAAAFQLDSVASRPVRRRLMLAWDDVFCVEYMHRKLRPYWQRGGRPFDAMLREADAGFPRLEKRCASFDARLMAELEEAGGPEYADLGALAFRQCIGAHKLAADFDGTPVFLSKENFSNGCIGTVDVTYPSAPFFLLFNPQLLKAQLKPVLDYAASPRWKFEFAPHDLGTYPLANGQVYGGGETGEENQMPVEECGNMVLLVAALAILSGDDSLAREYDGLCGKWADYLVKKGLDPENQLCTDDFAGHLAHNVNLSLKAIAAIGAYGKQLSLIGQRKRGAAYRAKARKLAARWSVMAREGDHYKLTFDAKGAWSQKYNLVWDRLLGLGLFPASVARAEIAHYLTRQGPYGLPLDSRSAYTKLDWIVWSAAMAEKDADFKAFIAPLHRWLQETPDRVPLTDWFWTDSGRHRGFQARSVVGGVFIRMLTDRKGKAWA